MQVDDFGAVLAQPIDRTSKIHGFSHNYHANAELADEAAAIPAGRQGGDHDFVAITALAARLSKGIRFSMHRRITFLHSAVVAAPQQFSFAFEQRGPDRNSSFGEPEARFFHGHFQHGEIPLAILVQVRSHFSPEPASLPYPFISRRRQPETSSLRQDQLANRRAPLLQRRLRRGARERAPRRDGKEGPYRRSSC